MADAAPKTTPQFDPTAPIYGMLQQTPAKNFTTYFTGEDAEKDCLVQSEHLARTTKRPVIVFGPQVAAFGPPPDRASAIPLNF